MKSTLESVHNTLEQKNLQRQNFVLADVGKHKAAVLAQRYGRAYGVNVIPILKRVTGSAADLFDGVSGSPSFNQSMVIMCVDTADARRAIIKTVTSATTASGVGQGPFYIDAGNEDNFGQVRFFNHAVGHLGIDPKTLTLPKLSPCLIDILAIPMDVEYYDTLVDIPGQGSCSDLDQTLAINALMGAEIMGIVQNYYYVRPMIYNQVSLSLDGARSTTFNTASDLIKRSQDDTKPSATSMVYYSTTAYMDIGPLLTKFIRDTDKALAKINATTVKAEAVEKAPELASEAPAKKRSRKKVDLEATAAAAETLTVADLTPPVAAPAEPVAFVGGPGWPTTPATSQAAEDDIPF